MVFTEESTTTVFLLWALHDKDSMKCLTLEMKPGKQDTDSKPVRRLVFCPMCLYHSSNDLSYMNHVVVMHYNVAYGCGRCLKAVLLMGQTLKAHLRSCEGFPKDNTASSSDQESMQHATQESPHHTGQCGKDTKPKNSTKSSSHTKESSSHSSEHKKSKKKSRDRDDMPRTRTGQDRDHSKSKKSLKK